MATGAGCPDASFLEERTTFSAFVVWQKTVSLFLRNGSMIHGVLCQNVLQKPVNDSELTHVMVR